MDGSVASERALELRRRVRAARSGGCVWSRDRRRDGDRDAVRAANDRDHGCVERGQLRCDELVRFLVARAHRRQLRVIALVIRAVAVRRIRAAARRHDVARAQLRDRHGERDDDGHQNGGGGAREPTDSHRLIWADPRAPVNAAPLQAITDRRPAFATGDARAPCLWNVGDRAGATATRRRGRGVRSIAATCAA